MRKKIIVGIALVLVLVLVCGIHLIYKNYQFGQELYRTVNEMSVQSYLIADSIDFLEMQFAKPDLDYSKLGSLRHAFDSAIVSTWCRFGDENMPILEDVRCQYIDRFTDLFHQIANDLDHARLISLFTDPDKANEMTVLKNQLYIMTECFNDFSERYNQMSDWERCFHSWKNERKILTEQVRIP